ncbi:Hypothetical predicted protein [Cloeon dipterum]|uniref:3-hydroxyacyl-CoA dehydrogenase n=1 Tax=Cloeon dipterum TaxID=197152 RepID=A0A8S1DA09_9INSE|nr:Hypothetical predicted protein [Cloeon dipterum]
MLPLANTLARRSFSTSMASSAVIKNVTIIGGGLMGSGIAQVAAQTGHKVTLVDLDESVLSKAKNSITANLGRVAKKKFKDAPAEGEKFVAGALANLSTNTDACEAARSADLVLEAIVEDLKVKHKLFSSLDPVAPAHAIFASNTSSLSIEDISQAAPSRKENFGGLHFFNPVPVMKLLEVIRTPFTSDETYQAMMAWGMTLGKVAITCRDTPGFVVNRLLVPYLAEAARLVERGDATARDVDIAMKLGTGYPMGPFELLDYVGLDTNKFVLDGWSKKYPDEPLFKPVPLVNEKVAQGKLGIKSGEGFYNYKKQ